MKLNQKTEEEKSSLLSLIAQLKNEKLQLQEAQDLKNTESLASN